MDKRSKDEREERRKGWRIRVEIRVEVAESREEILAFTEDIGGGGARFICKHNFHAGDIVTLQIPEFSTAKLAAEVLECADVEFKKDYMARVHYIDPDPSTIKQLLDFLYKRSYNR